MSSLTRREAMRLGAASLVAAGAAAPARADSAAAIEAKVNRALEQLFATVPGARELNETAKGVLIMPEVVKAGLLLGGAYGEGALRVDGATVSYYSLAAASFGLQIGVQSTKQALFFMSDAALAKFRRDDGWEAGIDAEVTFPGAGVNAGVDTTTKSAPVIGIVFGQDGILAGASFEGAKYSRINR